MELNAVEQFLKTNGGFASTKTLMKKMNLNKKQVRRLVMNSTHLNPVKPYLVGSYKNYLPIFEYSEVPHIVYFKRRTSKKRELIVQLESE
jgi:hypothetical protein